MTHVQGSRRMAWVGAFLALAGLVACGGSEEESSSSEGESSSSMSASAMGESGESPSAMGESGGSASAMGGAAARPDAVPDSLPNGLLVTYSPFGQNDQGRWVEPQPARLELITRHGGEWHVEAITDEDSNVFHKAMAYTPPGGEPAILTIGGMGAFVKLWRRGDEGWASETLWTEDFGGRFNRMRDVEVGDLYGDGKPAMAIATHDQGVFATIRPTDDGFQVQKTDRQGNLFIHEIELGDLNGDGTLEVYTTPSEPNRMGGEQSGQVVRYVPANGLEGEVVADLGNRHAKEIWVGDVDGDGRDELYVSVEGLTERGEQGLSIVEPVEIRRYEADTPPTEGKVIAQIDGDHLMRFLTVGDVDGDGQREMVAASFSRGLWLLRPGSDPNGEWSKESIDRDSGGFEHASVFADLDGDGSDELYVASDNDGELRRYVWVNGRARRTVIHGRDQPRSMITWNIMPAPASLLRGE
ncbi:MAG TPA: VCBS repeat-containing protein [Polyangiaceae bacterium LLY-WYZ-15_(1-7)]|nr:VCBS repeat-containing protein [Polyangiaceae bacterium LLY-WYZ-15_(1-7)]